MEWAVLAADVKKINKKIAVLQALKERDQKAWALGERVLFVPTFYAWGRVA